MSGVWAGVDVGGPRKGFHAAAVSDSAVVGLAALADAGDVVDWLRGLPHVEGPVAVDAPCALAPPGARSRPDEVAFLARGICALFPTPSPETLAARTDSYYSWIENGLALYAGLAAAGIGAFECFPTASWTVWSGGRAGRSRAAWSRAALLQHGLEGVPPRQSQDARDAIGAALTARAHSRGATECIGRIVIPLAGRPAA